MKTEMTVVGNTAGGICGKVVGRTASAVFTVTKWTVRLLAVAVVASVMILIKIIDDIYIATYPR